MKQPRDNHGHFVPLECPFTDCGGGTLVEDSDGVWRCDGLIDPGDNGPLEACPFTHTDGEPYIVRSTVKEWMAWFAEWYRQQRERVDERLAAKGLV